MVVSLNSRLESHKEEERHGMSPLGFGLLVPGSGFQLYAYGPSPQLPPPDIKVEVAGLRVQG